MKRFIDIGTGLPMPTYNLFIALGIALAMLLLQYNRQFKKLRVNDQYIIHLSLVTAIIAGFVCAYIFDAISQGISLISFRAGLTLLGGLIPAIFIVVIVLQYHKIKILQTLNLITPYFAITHCMGRIGCFFAGCCFGKPTKSIPGVIFPKGSIPFEHYHMPLPLHPTQLYEAAFAIGMFIIFKYAKPKHMFFIYIALYSFFRFFLEYFRADDRGVILNQTLFSPSQIICLIMFITISFIALKVYWFNQKSLQTQ